MTREIEHYMIDKIRKALEGEDGRKPPLQNKFGKILKLLEEDLDSSSPDTLSDIRAKLLRLNNVLTQCRMMSQNCGLVLYPPQNVWSLYKINTELNQITEKQDQEKKKKNRDDLIQNTNAGAPSSDQGIEAEEARWIPRSIDKKKVRGFDNEIMSLLKLILQRENEKQFKAIGVVGPSGIGKTTLCRAVFNEPQLRENFCPRIWVSMSRPTETDPDPKTAVVRRVLERLGLEEQVADSIAESRGLEGLVYALHLQLVGKKYLIVLDDCREREEWYEQLDSNFYLEAKWGDRLAYGFPKGEGGTVVVTSRDEEMARKMAGREENLQRVLPLTDAESCWEIFRDAVERDGRRFQFANEEDLKREIKQKCMGLPLAAKVLGEILYEPLRRTHKQNGVADLQTQTQSTEITSGPHPSAETREMNSTQNATLASEFAGTQNNTTTDITEV